MWALLPWAQLMLVVMTPSSLLSGLVVLGMAWPAAAAAVALVPVSVVCGGGAAFVQRPPET